MVSKTCIQPLLLQHRMIQCVPVVGIPSNDHTPRFLTSVPNDEKYLNARVREYVCVDLKWL